MTDSSGCSMTGASSLHPPAVHVATSEARPVRVTGEVRRAAASARPEPIPG
jgi:hypothetical protein